MSVHGICFDNGMAGRCGIECEGFIFGNCDVFMEVAESCKAELLAEYGNAFVLGVINAQTKLPKEPLIEKEVARILSIEFGYK